MGGEVESGKGYGKMRGSRFWVEEGGKKEKSGNGQHSVSGVR